MHSFYKQRCARGMFFRTLFGEFDFYSKHAVQPSNIEFAFLNDWHCAGHLGIWSNNIIFAKLCDARNGASCFLNSSANIKLVEICIAWVQTCSDTKNNKSKLAIIPTDALCGDIKHEIYRAHSSFLSLRRTLLNYLELKPKNWLKSNGYIYNVESQNFCH